MCEQESPVKGPGIAERYNQAKAAFEELELEFNSKMPLSIGTTPEGCIAIGVVDETGQRRHFCLSPPIAAKLAEGLARQIARSPSPPPPPAADPLPAEASRSALERLLNAKAALLEAELAARS